MGQKADRLRREIRECKELIERVEKKREGERAEIEVKRRAAEGAQRALDEACKEEQSTASFLYVQYEKLRYLHRDFFEAVDKGE